MKIRNGFISNSSSSSFLVFMPNKLLSINEIEEYFGGYSDKLTKKQKDLLTILIWTAQYRASEYAEEHCNSDNPETEIIYKCKYKNCPDAYVFDEHYPEKICLNCKNCTRIERPIRKDNYYELLEYLYDGEVKDRVEANKDKSIFNIELDDNEPPSFMSYAEAYELRQIENWFKDDSKSLKEY